MARIARAILAKSETYRAPTDSSRNLVRDAWVTLCFCGPPRGSTSYSGGVLSGIQQVSGQDQVMTCPIKLDPNRVSRPLAHLVPVAEKWGDADDDDREQAVKSASRSELEALLHCIDEVSDDYLLGWLAGPGSSNDNPSPEYVAFTCLRMVIDSAKPKLESDGKKMTKVRVLRKRSRPATSRVPASATLSAGPGARNAYD
jgi:hypothetical protein